MKTEHVPSDSLNPDETWDRMHWHLRELVIPRKNGKSMMEMEMQIRELERWGCITPNEGRAMRGLPVIPGGDYIDVLDDIVGEPDVIHGDDCGPLFSAATRQGMRPFVYGLAFLLLLWGCMVLAA